MDTISLLAYVLCEPVNKTQIKLKKQILHLKKDLLIEDTKKSNIDIRKKAMFLGDDYQNIYSVLEAALKSKDVKRELILNMILAYATDWASKPPGKPDICFCDDFDYRWDVYGRFLREYSSVEEVKQVLKSHAEKTKNKKFEKLIHAQPFVILFYDDIDALPDFNSKKSDYIDENIDLIAEIVTRTLYVILFESMPKNFENKYAAIAQDYISLKSVQKRINERKAAALRKDNKLIPITKEEEMCLMFDGAMLKVSSEYTLQDIDLPMLIRTAGISKKDIKESVKKAYELFVIKGGDLRNKAELYELIIRQIAILAISKKTGELYKNKAPSKNDSEELKIARKKITELNQKNEILTKKLNKPQEKDNRDDKIKALYGEIAQLNKQLRKKDKEIEKLNNETIEAEISTQVEIEYTDDTREQFEKYIQDHKVMVWGMRDNDVLRLQEIFPTLKFMSSDYRLTQKQIDAYDIVLIGTGYTNHGSFWITRDFLKNAGKPFAYMKKSDKNADALAKAWAIAMRS